MSSTAARVRGQVAERDQAADLAKAQREEVEGRIRQARGWFAAVVPAHVNPDQFIALALGVIRRDPQLTAAAIQNPASFMVALAECARLGLVIGDTYHLTHFRNRETGVPDIVGMTDYKGEIQMIYNAGSVAAVHCQVVRRGGPKPDRFRWQPGMTLPDHVIADDGLASEDERGPLQGVYAYATLRGGGYSAVIVMSRSEVAKHREASKTDKFWGPPWPGEGPWTPDMWAKTALHKLYDRVPHSAAHQAEMLRATTAWTQHAPAGMLDLPDGAPPPIPPPDYAAIMAGGAGPPPPAGGHAQAPREQPAGLRARQDAMTQIRQRFESAGLGGPEHAQTRLTLAGIMANPDGPPLILSNPAALDLAQAQAAAATLARVFDECAAQGRDPGEALQAIAAAAAAQAGGDG